MPQRILIADDNLTFRKTLRQLLEGVDHWEVIEARDGQEAVTLSVKTRPDVIVLDLAMPAKDGLTAAREISTLLPATPVLMCTMHMSAQIEAEAQKSGIKKVLSKTDSNLILPAIRQFIRPTEAPIQASESAPVPVAAIDPEPEGVVSVTTAVEAATDSPTKLPKNVA